jgi:hypothetical protein
MAENYDNFPAEVMYTFKCCSLCEEVFNPKVLLHYICYLFLNRAILIFVALIPLISSCRKENAGDCFKSNGAETTRTRYPGEFKYLEAYDKMDVTIYKGAEYKV